MRPDLFKKDGPLKDFAWVLELNKALYGLKQSPRMWHQKLHSVMTEMGFKLFECDHSIWVELLCEVINNPCTFSCSKLSCKASGTISAIPSENVMV